MSISLFDLTGKRALVTGSSQGIGHALARGLAAAGAEVVLNGRDAAKLKVAAADLGARHALVFDATDHGAVQAAIDGFEAETGPIDILVNNAGMTHRMALEDFPADTFELLLRTNISSVFNVGQAVARHMIRRGAGKIVNIASVQTALARPGIAPYAATKGAVGNLTKGMATDWANTGCSATRLRRDISIPSLRPPWSKTPHSPVGWRIAYPPAAGAGSKSWWAPVFFCRLQHPRL